ncbi:MAG TPA: site-specific integrase [Anaerohalosphaeraceae bacterium]|nr:site-specific integrase [Anaerohalosphaeraceae bacterium]
MAKVRNIDFCKKRNCWRVRKQIKDPQSGKKYRLEKYLPHGGTKEDAIRVQKKWTELSQNIKLGRMAMGADIDTAYRQFLDHCKRHTERTQKLYENVITRFLTVQMEKVRSVNEISVEHIEDYLQGIIKTSTNRTANCHLTVIKSFFTWFCRRHKTPNPAGCISMFKEDPPDSRFLTEAEYQKIMEAANPLFRRRFVFIANTGLRASEFSQLTWGQVSEDLRSITIIGKGRKRRFIPLNQTAQAILKDLRSGQDKQPDQYVFTSDKCTRRRQNIPTSRKALGFQCSLIAEKLNLRSFGPHAFRHYFATSMILAGVPISHVSRILGHSSVKTTETIYVHVSPQHLVGMTDCLDRKPAPTAESQPAAPADQDQTAAAG